MRAASPTIYMCADAAIGLDAVVAGDGGKGVYKAQVAPAIVPQG